MTTKAKASIVAVLTVLVFGACVGIMVQRIRANLREHPPTYFIFQEVTGTDFGFAGRGSSGGSHYY